MRWGCSMSLLPEVARGRGVTQPGEFHAYDVFEHGTPRGRGDGRDAGADAPGRRDGVDVGRAVARVRLVRARLAGVPRRGDDARDARAASLLKLAALLHDVAKPQTRDRARPTAASRFLGHADLARRVAARIMRRYRFSAREVRFVSVLVAEHLRPVQLAQVGEVPTRRALYRFYRDLGDAAPAVLLLVAGGCGGGARAEDDVRGVVKARRRI